MSARKTKIEPSYIKNFLQNRYNSSVTGLTILTGGEMSCPFSFRVNAKEFVIRVDPYIQSYLKDNYAREYFGSEKLPIPEMVSYGKLDEKYYYAITEKAHGKTLDICSPSELVAINPSLISVLEEIHAVNISKTKGYGYWDPDSGNAPFETWKEYILSVDNDMGEWMDINYQTVFTKDIYEKIYEKIVSLVGYCPEERVLLHGDFGGTNIIVDSEKVTAVLDWGESRYGDFVFDIAWLDAWEDRVSYEEIFTNYYEKKGIMVPHFMERVCCYKLLIYYGALKFFTESKQEAKAKGVVERVRLLL